MITPTDAQVVAALTTAQRKFLVDTISLGALGFSVDVLSGPETAMARRLEGAGLLKREHIPRALETHWQITPAGRRAVQNIGASK